MSSKDMSGFQRSLKFSNERSVISEHLFKIELQGRIFVYKPKCKAIFLKEIFFPRHWIIVCNPESVIFLHLKQEKTDYIEMRAKYPKNEKFMSFNETSDSMELLMAKSVESVSFSHLLSKLISILSKFFTMQRKGRAFPRR